MGDLTQIERPSVLRVSAGVTDLSHDAAQIHPSAGVAGRVAVRDAQAVQQRLVVVEFRITRRFAVVVKQPVIALGTTLLDRRPVAGAVLRHRLQAREVAFGASTDTPPVLPRFRRSVAARRTPPFAGSHDSV